MAPEVDSGMKNVSLFPAVAPSLRLMVGCLCSSSGKKLSGHRACGATLRINIKFLCASLKYSWRSEWGYSCVIEDRYCHLYATAFSHRLFFFLRLMVSKERSLDLFVTVQQECYIPFSSFASWSIPVSSWCLKCCFQERFALVLAQILEGSVRKVQNQRSTEFLYCLCG